MTFPLFRFESISSSLNGMAGLRTLVIRHANNITRTARDNIKTIFLISCPPSTNQNLLKKITRFETAINCICNVNIFNSHNSSISRFCQTKKAGLKGPAHVLTIQNSDSSYHCASGTMPFSTSRPNPRDFAGLPGCVTSRQTELFAGTGQPSGTFGSSVLV